jgi:hypothetical protein
MELRKVNPPDAVARYSCGLWDRERFKDWIQARAPLVDRDVAERIASFMDDPQAP